MWKCDVPCKCLYSYYTRRRSTAAPILRRLCHDVSLFVCLFVCGFTRMTRAPLTRQRWGLLCELAQCVTPRMSQCCAAPIDEACMNVCNATLLPRTLRICLWAVRSSDREAGRVGLVGREREWRSIEWRINYTAWSEINVSLGV